MKRGEIWTVAGGGDYTGKPRPVVIIQDDRYDATESVTVCAFTTDPTHAPLFRISIEPTRRNGLAETSSIMADKITTIRRSRLGERIGRLERREMTELNRAVLAFLGLVGGSPKMAGSD